LICRTGYDVFANGGPRSVTVEQSEMSKWAVILLLVDRPSFDFKQTTIAPFDFLQYLLWLRFAFALRASARKIRSFDVLTNPQ
jgi:hypothetical protein